MYILSTAFACNLVVYRTFVLSVCLAERSWPLISRLFLRIWLAYHPNTCCLPHVQNLLSVCLSTVCALCLSCRAKLSINIGSLLRIRLAHHPNTTKWLRARTYVLSYMVAPWWPLGGPCSWGGHRVVSDAPEGWFSNASWDVPTFPRFRCGK